MSDFSSPDSARAARRAALWPVAGAFLVFGTFWGGWAVAAADIERDLGVSHARFGLIFSVGLLGGALSNALGGPLAERHGTSRVLAVALAIWAGVLLIAAVVPSTVGLGVMIVAVIATAGLVDVLMNIAATAELGDKPGALVRFHAFFNGGAAIGACATGLLIGQGLSWRFPWFGVALLMVALAVVGVRRHVRAAAEEPGEPAEHVSLMSAPGLLRREGLVLLATAFAIGAMVEGGIELWGVLYLRRQLASGLLVGAASAVVAYLIATAARVLLGPAAGRRGAATGLLVGCSAAAAGLLLLASAPVVGLAAIGLVLAAGGISLSWPLLLAHATSGHPRPGLVVGAVSAVGYTGFVLGPTLIGALSDVIGLRGGLVLLAGGAVFVAASPFLGRRRMAVAVGAEGEE